MDDLGVTKEGEEEEEVAWPGESRAEEEVARRGSGGSTRRRGRTRRSAGKPKKVIAYAREAGPRRT